MYLIFQELFKYSKVTKSKINKKTIIIVFADVQLLIKHFKIVLTLKKDIYNNNKIIIALNFIYNDFNTKISSFLKIDDKIIDKIL